MLSSIGNSTQMASRLFQQLDSKSQGYIEKTDLASAFSAISDDSSSDVDDLFSALDTDSDGKVTESEFTSTLSKLQEELDSQFNQMRMQGMAGGAQGMGGMPPPPPANDEGFTQEELQAQLDEIGDSDSQRSSLISSIVDNFSSADTDSDGKVTFQEAMAYRESSEASSSSSTNSSAASTSSSTASSSSTGNDAEIMFQIMRLMHAYGGLETQQGSSLLSTTA